jgi:geranylgeranyl diphosphate synthase type II
VTLEARMVAHRQEVEAMLDRLLPPEDRLPQQLHRAMRYTLLAPGKRVRPVLTMLCGEIFAAPTAPLIRAASAVEMVHASSLILDDLPCMDDAQLRRGLATCHQVFGESTALLAALGLLNMAFDTLANLPESGLSAKRAAEASRVLAGAIGSDGLISGQVVDLEAGESVSSLETLEFIHSHKTGQLFIASAELGALLGRARPRERDAVARFAKNLGLAFQITDDLLDATADVRTLGKDVRKDKGRTTFATLSGLAGARALADELIDHAVAALEPLGRRGEALRDLAERIRVRHA